MTEPNNENPLIHVGNTVLVVTMDVDEADESEFNE